MLEATPFERGRDVRRRGVEIGEDSRCATLTSDSKDDVDDSERGVVGDRYCSVYSNCIDVPIAAICEAGS